MRPTSPMPCDCLNMTISIDTKSAVVIFFVGISLFRGLRCLPIFDDGLAFGGDQRFPEGVLSFRLSDFAAILRIFALGFLSILLFFHEVDKNQAQQENSEAEEQTIDTLFS